MTIKTINLTGIKPEYNNELNELIEASLSQTTLNHLKANSERLAQMVAALHIDEAVIPNQHPIFPYLKNELKWYNVKPIAV